MPAFARIEYPEALEKRLLEALIKQGKDYQPRTELLLANGKAKYINRLILESSPYLIQHAHNPVNWYPWSKEAFATAKAENKPIFLSIGYSTCHWCHVMERESFDNEKIAAYLNEHFICIKVDREQRPDVDSYYMTGVMLTTGRGGWPMSNFIISDGKPFFGGTYFPADHFRQILERIIFAWNTQYNELSDSAEQLSAAITRMNSSKNNAQKIDRNIINTAIKAIMQGYNAQQGGFSSAPKFPNEPFLFLLLRQMVRNTDESVSKALTHTLNAMAQGGIYDQVGGGFHRYSTDNNWLIPHFEKMLYNQAHLARVYLQAYKLTGESSYKRIVVQTLDYLLREMQAAEGGFYSATDADSEGEEGLFFVWTEEQLKSILPPDLANTAIDLFKVSKRGNFEGRNILHLPIALNEYAKTHRLALTELHSQVDKIRQALRISRIKREHPLRDDKILTAWNAMVISALAEASWDLNQPEYLDKAMQAAEFLWHNNRMDSGKLYRANLKGQASVIAVQEDYAYFAEALLRLYDVTNDRNWLQKAQQITDTMLKEFWDTQQGGFFMASQSKIVPHMQRLKEVNDGAIPSGNSVAVKVLAELEKRTGEMAYQEKAWGTLAAFSGQITNNPASYAYLLIGADQLLDGETGDIQFAARGAVSVRGKLDPVDSNNYLLKIDLQIKSGWHINAHQPLQKDLIATEIALKDKLKGWQLEAVSYPPALQKKINFQRSILALYEGTIQLQAKIKKQNTDNRLLPINLTLQACNDQYCLAPENIQLNISAIY